MVVLAVAFLSATATAQPAVELRCNDEAAGYWSSLSWPANDPVWTLDFRKPEHSSGQDGSGLEIRDVYYRGKLVLSRGHAPILNVQYDTGSGCGCFRDWSTDTATMAVTGPISGCFASADAGSVQTTCDLPAGGDTGSFKGIAAEDFGDRLVLSTHMQAGWYRYRMFWIFHRNGRIEPRYSYTAATNVCTGGAHRHHVYWRLDFDIETASNNAVMEFTADQPEGRRLLTEQRLYSGPPQAETNWLIFNTQSELGYRLTPGSYDLQLPPDTFSDADGYVLRYQAGATGPLELDDAGNQCAINFSSLLNNESINDTDIVFWYRGGAYHEPNDPWHCDMVGPTIEPVGDWGQHVSVDPNPTQDQRFTLSAPFPNPAFADATVMFSVAEPVRVRVILFDSLGRQLGVLYDDVPVAGESQSVRYDSSDLPAGTYTIRLVGPDYQGSVRATVVR
ncbi:hypothetical protein BH23BAC4_BH23BAC4_06550 [soil metagenome]